MVKEKIENPDLTLFPVYKNQAILFLDAIIEKTDGDKRYVMIGYKNGMLIQEDYGVSEEFEMVQTKEEVMQQLAAIDFLYSKLITSVADINDIHKKLLKILKKIKKNIKKYGD